MQDTEEISLALEQMLLKCLDKVLESFRGREHNFWNCFESGWLTLSESTASFQRLYGHDRDDVRGSVLIHLRLDSHGEQRQWVIDSMSFLWNPVSALFPNKRSVLCLGRDDLRNARIDHCLKLTRVLTPRELANA